MSKADWIKVGYRLTGPDGVWGTIIAMSTGEWVIVSWDDGSDDTVIPWDFLIVEEP